MQSLFKLDDGERIVRMIGFDSRMLEVPPVEEGATEPGAPYIVAVTKQGMTMTGSLRPHREPSTRSGRRFMRVDSDDEVVYVGLKPEKRSHLACVTVSGHALICDGDEVSLLAGPGKGVRLIKLEEDDVVVGAQLLRKSSDMLLAEKESGTEFEISDRQVQTRVARRKRPRALSSAVRVAKVVTPAPEVPSLPESK